MINEVITEAHLEGMGESGYHKTVIQPSVTVTEIDGTMISRQKYVSVMIEKQKVR